ncbi:MAG: 2-oxo acid dehydrogenase subunit E2 [Clostridiales Family XIII bacterium]|jgi:pyruvate dehydrogenase E2 component (dihydrolipoamide acetyltransferase)|nr:2-oxo acid dehydrogenase subunit E2 [Clostridiales Family XIII bacterium]
MRTRIDITPRARRIAEEHGVDITALNIKGTAFRGGVGERDIRLFLVDAKSAEGRDDAVPSDIRMTPLASRVAAAEGVDVSGLRGSGAFGKIVKSDVLAAAGRADRSPAEREGTAPGEAVSNGDKRIARAVPYTGVRRIIGERLAQSKFTAPHLYFTQKVDLSELLKLRTKVNARDAGKTSVTDYIARACVLSLMKHPELNASLVGDRIEEYANVNVGVAVATPSGLIVPVIKDAQDMSLVELSAAAASLVGKAREGKLMPDEYSGGTFTISNLGMFGIENFTAIINPPESGILAISSTKDEAVVVTGAEDGEKTIAIRPMMNITLSVDHRLIDGLLAAQFVTEVKRLLESPIELLV